MMTITYNTASFRNGRTTVMGIATLLIIWFHGAIWVKPDSLLARIKLISDIGVDMFLFASGAGVYFAVKKYGKFWPYIKSRMCRVLPAYLTVAIPWFAYQDIVLRGSRRLFLKDVTMLSFWTDGLMTSWYVAVILLLYILTPVYMRLWERFRNLDKISICVVYGAMLLVMVGNLYSYLGYAIALLQRLPVYLMGLSFGKAMKQGRIFRIKTAWVVLTMAICSVLVASAIGWLPWKLPSAVKYLAFGPAAAIISMACATITANRFTDYFGQRSLEVYLVLEKVQVTLGEYREMEPLMEYSAIPFFALAFGITLLLAEILKWITVLFKKGIHGNR